jgi:hypothetical protein
MDGTGELHVKKNKLKKSKVACFLSYMKARPVS